MSDLSYIDFKNKMVLVWTTLKMCLHEIEQIAMRSVCLEISSNMFMILFRVEIDFSVTKNFSFRKKSLSTGGRDVWSSYPGGNVEPEGASKTKKSCLF